MLKFQGVTTSKIIINLTIIRRYVGGVFVYLNVKYKICLGLYLNIILGPIPVGSASQLVEILLNNLPVLAPNLVTVTESFSSDNVSKIYTVQFNSAFGDVPDIEEVFGEVNSTVKETTKGVASGSKIQLNIEGAYTNLFDVTNNTDVII